jgi:hypothetical protein
MSELLETRRRMEVLRAFGRTPLEVTLSNDAWDKMKVEFQAEAGRTSLGVISGLDVLGVPIQLFPKATTISILYEGGVDTAEK